MGRSGGAVFLIVMTEFLSTHWLDIVTTILGLIYLVLEYRASIALWVGGIVMPAMDIYLYWSHGLYGDAGMAVYYTLAAIYGYAVWKFGAKWKRMLKRKASGAAGSDKALEADGSDKAVDVAGSDKAVDAAGGSSEGLPDNVLPVPSYPAHARLLPPRMGCYLLRSRGLHQQHRALARRVHQRSQLCRLVGFGAQVRRAVAVLDSRRRGLLLSVCGERHTVQGRVVRPVCRDSGHGIHKVEGPCEKGITHLDALGKPRASFLVLGGWGLSRVF